MDTDMHSVVQHDHQGLSTPEITVKLRSSYAFLLVKGKI